MYNYPINLNLDTQTETEIDKLYNHEIKAKRVKKEISHLNELHLDNVNVEQVRYSSIGIRIPATYEKKGKHWRFEVRIDREYPFTRPQLHSLDKQNNLISEARDLLAMVLDEGQNWGPYLMLNKFIEDIPQLVSKIQATPGVLLGRYWDGCEYDLQELQQKGLTIFKLTQNTWKYMLKHSSPKIFGVSSNVILKLQQLQQSTPNRLRLEFSIYMKDIKEIVSNPTNNQMTVKFMRNQKEEIMYLASTDSIDNLLEHINPVQMVERRVKAAEAKKETNEQLIKDYGFLIDYYSARDEAVSNTYVGKMKDAIKKRYEVDMAAGKNDGAAK